MTSGFHKFRQGKVYGTLAEEPLTVYYTLFLS